MLLFLAVFMEEHKKVISSMLFTIATLTLISVVILHKKVKKLILAEHQEKYENYTRDSRILISSFIMLTLLCAYLDTIRDSYSFIPLIITLLLAVGARCLSYGLGKDLATKAAIESGSLANALTSTLAFVSFLVVHDLIDIENSSFIYGLVQAMVVSIALSILFSLVDSVIFKERLPEK